MLTKTFRIIAAVLTVACIIFILANGAAQGDTSSSLSAVVCGWINSALSLIGDIRVSEHFVRKLAHFTEYSLLGGLMTLAAASNIGTKWRFRRVWIPISGAALVAISDEVIQRFTPGRCGCITDVLLDLSGIVWASLLAAAISAHYISKYQS